MAALDNLLGLLGGQTYLGNTLFQYVLFFATIIAFVILGKIIYYVLKHHVSKLTAKTKTNLDDIIIKMVQKPLIMGLFIAGLLIGLQFLTLPEDIASLASNTIGVLITLLIMWVIIKVVDVVIKEGVGRITAKTDSTLDDEIVPLFSKVTKVIIIVFFLIIILDNFGYDVTAMIAGLGIGGLAFAFAAKETIADAFGGFSILTSRPFATGETIVFEGMMGTVEQVGIRHTRIRNLDKRLVTIPNSKLANGIIENVTSAPARKVVLNLGLTYDTPAKNVKKGMEILKKIIETTKGCRKEPHISFSEFKDSSLNIFVIYYIEDFDNWLNIRGEVNMKIKEEFDKAKLDFAFPSQTIYVKK